MPFETELGALEDDPGRIQEFLDKVIAQREPDDSRPQHQLEASVEVIPVDEKFQRRLKPFEILTRDLSVDGMGFWYEDPLAVDFAIVRVFAEDGSILSVGTRILRCEEREDRFDVGCQFMLAGMHP